MSEEKIKVAYFSAEIGIDSKIKTYSGGLGILSGDTIKAMADLKFPLCAVTLLYKDGFFKQKIIDGVQTEEPDTWDFQNILKETGKETKVRICGTDIHVKIWETDYYGNSGHRVPIYFLDTDIHTNPKWAQKITNKLYQGDRLHQEMVLGIAGVKALAQLGHDSIEKYHMNEGHSAFLTLQMYKYLGETQKWSDDLVKSKCVFTTHTPIPAGHDKFDYERVYDSFHEKTELIPWHIRKIAGEDQLNMTHLAMHFSSYINAVSRKHCEVTKEMFPMYNINYITNGIHCASWVNPHMAKVFDDNIQGWRDDNTKLKEIFKVDNNQILEAHKLAKTDLIKFVNGNNIVDSKLKEDVLTVGFARRFIEYKDAELIFKNKDNLKRLGKKIQFIFAGKTHGNDGVGKDIMKRIIENAKELKDDIQIAFLEDYKIETAKLMVSGCDLWLNTPIPPNEASGTSGMKAAANGCLHFSRLDGWAIESFEMNGGGFPIAEYSDFIKDLEYQIIPTFYDKNSHIWAEEMKLAIGNSASYFNTHRMCREYITKAYKMKLE